MSRPPFPFPLPSPDPDDPRRHDVSDRPREDADEADDVWWCDTEWSLFDLDRRVLPDGRVAARPVARRAGESDAARLARRAGAAKAWLADERVMPNLTALASLGGVWRTCPLARCRRARACLGARPAPGAAPRWISSAPVVCRSPAGRDGDGILTDAVAARVTARDALRAAGLLPPAEPPRPAPPRPAPVAAARQPSRKGRRS